MKLLKCHVENFGKLSNFDYEFEDGLNTIKEDNGFGKTTFAGFIKAMFYGLDAKKNTKVLIDRKKYEPWQGGAFGGYIEFELKNKKYKIERFFGKKESDDTFKLYDLETNLESNDYKSNIGEEIFKLNKEAYERSSFISGQNMETSMNDSINAKLGNILESENDINTSEQALKNLDEAIKNYKKTGGRGALNEKILERTKLEKKLEQSKIDEKNLQSRKDKNAKLREIIKQKEKELADQKNLITLHMKNEARKAKIENYKMLEKNANENKAILEEYENFFKNGIPEDEDIETLIEKCILLEKCKTEIRNYDISPEDKSEIENLKSLFQGQHISEDIINNKISAYNKLNDIKNEIKINEEKITNLNKEKTSLNKQKNNSRIIGLIICLISVILVAVGIGAYFKDLKNIALYILIGGAVFFIIFIIETILSNKKNKQIEDKEEKLNEASKLTKRLEKDVLHIQNDLTDFTDQYSDKEICLDMILELTEIKSKYMKYKDLKNNIDSIFEKQNEVVRKFDELEESVKDYLLGYFEEIDDTYVNYAQ